MKEEEQVLPNVLRAPLTCCGMYSLLIHKNQSINVIKDCFKKGEQNDEASSVCGSKNVG